MWCRRPRTPTSRVHMCSPATGRQVWQCSVNPTGSSWSTTFMSPRPGSTQTCQVSCFCFCGPFSINQHLVPLYAIAVLPPIQYKCSKGTTYVTLPPQCRRSRELLVCSARRTSLQRVGEPRSRSPATKSHRWTPTGTGELCLFRSWSSSVWTLIKYWRYGVIFFEVVWVYYTRDKDCVK